MVNTIEENFVVLENHHMYICFQMLWCLKIKRLSKNPVHKVVSTRDGEVKEKIQL